MESLKDNVFLGDLGVDERKIFIKLIIGDQCVGM
jgi:hypothetical protein